MDEIAAQAGTSKTVIYRHFGDRAGLYAAVVAQVHQFIHADLSTALELNDPADLPALVIDLADAYLRLVEDDPEIYRFVLSPPVPNSEVDPWGGLPELMGAHLSEAIADQLRRRGQDPACATTWGHGLVGLLRAAADAWMATNPRPPRTEVLQHIRLLVLPALEPSLLAVPSRQGPRP